MGEAAVSAPAVERQLAFDLTRRGLLVAPLVVLVTGAVRGPHGALSAAIAVAVVCANFVAAALIVDRAAAVSGTAVAVASAAGYVVRLAVIVVALVALRHLSFVDLPVLGFTLVGAHLGLLGWEARHVSMSLAAPGLRPRRPVSTGDR